LATESRPRGLEAAELIGTEPAAGALFRMTNQTLPATAFKSPAIALSGVVDYEMYTKFRTQFDNASDQNIVVIELPPWAVTRKSRG
jgi:hypothetical protein